MLSYKLIPIFTFQQQQVDTLSIELSLYFSEIVADFSLRLTVHASPRLHTRIGLSQAYIIQGRGNCPNTFIRGISISNDFIQSGNQKDFPWPIYHRGNTADIYQGIDKSHSGENRIFRFLPM